MNAKHGAPLSRDWENSLPRNQRRTPTIEFTSGQDTRKLLENQYFWTNLTTSGSQIPRRRLKDSERNR
jgi:hypothetical protein